MRYIKTLSLLLCLFICTSADKQYSSVELQRIAHAITQKGMQLYRSETAAWYGTDIFLSKYENRDSIGGYFCYPDSLLVKCIFYSHGITPHVIGTISFDSSYSTTNGYADLNEREFTPLEKEYYELRTAAQKLTNQDTIFKWYKNTNYNIVPLINGNEREVYIMTATQETGVILFGNDYHITFDKHKNPISYEPLHRSLIVFDYKKADSSVAGNIHTHLPEFSPFMTVTDICIAKLFENITGLHQYTTVSKDYISIWNGSSLFIIPRAEADSISKDHSKH